MLIHKLNKYILKVINIKSALIYFYFWSDCYEYKRFIWLYKKSKFFHIHVSQRDIFDWH